MQFSLAFHEIGKSLRDEALLREGLALTDDVLDHFRRPERQALVEYLALDNRPLPPPVGTLVSPGHGIETAWFQLENLRGRADPDRAAKALDVMRWSFEKGWDPEYGGLFLYRDLEGGEPWLPNGDKKIWWPHCEALCGALMAHEACGEPWALDWYWKVHDWSFAHFADREHGEWTQRLDRTGRRVSDVVALPVKDPFHLPRAAIYCVETLARLTS
jgi:N-acylglucosamine 2-epimerase